MSFSSLPQETALVSAKGGTSSPGGRYGPVSAAVTRVPPCPGLDCGGADPESDPRFKKMHLVITASFGYNY